MDIYHITHVDNLPSIISHGCLYSDRRQSEIEPKVVIGFDHIKQRRLQEITVTCHAGTYVGDYVPFYLCPRSVMLYVISRGHSELTYREGQRNIIHLVSTVATAVETAQDRPWAYSDGNAGAFYTRFYNDLDRIDEVIDWVAVNKTYWADPADKDKKQAEFLVHDHFPWTCFHEIGVLDQEILDRVETIIGQSSHTPRIRVRPSWYY
ncbi:DUF4433 domain-containing protein [Acidobacteria bacterium AH-259-L09]|nr:DUF4433 domain-containing protein [Acidobacteria bacterium AH-259-L09]